MSTFMRALWIVGAIAWAGLAIGVAVGGEMPSRLTIVVGFICAALFLINLARDET